MKQTIERIQLILILLIGFFCNTWLNGCISNPCGTPPSSTNYFTTNVNTSISATINLGSGTVYDSALSFTGMLGSFQVTSSSNGQFSFLYTPFSNAFGTDCITYNTITGGILVQTRFIQITINPSFIANPLNIATCFNISKTAQVTASSSVPGDIFAFSLVSGPLHGSLAGGVDAATGIFTYTPNMNFSGLDSFIFQAKDMTTGKASDATVTIIVDTMLLPNPLTIVACEGSSLTSQFSLTGGIAPFTYTVISPSLQGATITQPNGVHSPIFTYMATSFTGADSFLWFANDSLGCGFLNPGTVNVNVASQVIAGPVSFTTCNSQSSTNPFNATGGASSAYTFSIPSSGSGSPQHGTAVVNSTAGTFTYTPDSDFIGTDTFSYTVSDGICPTQSALITATVTRSPELVFQQNVVTCSNVGITNNISDDATLQELTATLVSGPSAPGATVSFQPAPGLIGVDYVYTPGSNFVGSDSFTFSAVNVTSPSCNSLGTININVIGLPTANSFAIAGCANNQILGTLQPSGGSGFYPAYSVQTPSINGGTIVPNTQYPNFLYTPALNFVGTDSFTYTVTDSNGCVSQSGTVTVTVKPFPVASNLSFTGCLGSTINGQLSATGGSGTYVYTIQDVSSFPQLISFDPNTGAFVWQLINSTTITFTYSVEDVLGCASNTASVQIIPLSATLPQVSPISFSLDENGSYNGTFVVSNPILGHTYNYTYSNGPNHGFLNPFNPSTGSFSYNPIASYVGPDNFLYQTIDITTGCFSNKAGATITVNPTLAPVVSNLLLSSCSNGTINGTMSAVGGTSPYIFSFFNGPSHGTLPIFDATTGQFVYQPTSGFTGQDSFNYVAADTGGSQSNVGTIVITVGSTAAPVAGPVSITSCLNGQVSGLFNVTGGLAPYTNYTVVVPPTQGQVTNINAATGSFVYVPTQNVIGSDSFSYIVTDSNGCKSNIAVVNVTINSTSSPLAQDQTLVVCENGMINGVFNLTGFVGLFDIVALPAHGTVTHIGTSQNFTYTPNNSFVGTDSFTFTVSDGSCVSKAGTITLNVTSAVAPTISNLSLITCQNGVVSASVNPVGGTSPYLTFIQQQPANGSATGSGVFSINPEVTYIPAFNYVGPDSFVYAIQDSSSPNNCFSVTGLATINVLNNVGPAVSEVDLVSCQGNAVTGNFIASGGTSPYNFTYSNGPNHGTITAFNPSTGQITYQPNLGYSGPDSLVYRVSDANACQSFTALLGIAVDSNVIATPLSISMCMGDSQDGQLTGTGGTLPYSFAFLTGPSHGTFTHFDSTTGEFTYKPATNYSGPDSFTFTIEDQVGCTGPSALVNITVDPVITALPLTLTACGDGSVMGTFQAVGGSGNYTFNFTNPPATSPSNGFVTMVNNNTFVYTSANGFIGSDSFMYTAIDVTTGCVSAPALVSISISDLAPTVEPVALAFCSNTPLANQLFASGGTLPYTFSFFNGPSHGTLSPFDIFTGIFVYNPSAGFSGQDAFSYIATDASGCVSAPATVEISVSSGIISNPVSLISCESNCKQGTFNSVGGSGSYIFNLTGTGPLNGQVFLGSGNTFTYCPTAGFVGTDSFGYYAKDLLNCDCVSNQATVSVTIETDPTVVSATFMGCLGSSITSQFSATGGSGSYTFNHTNPQNGNLILGNNGTFSYQPVVSNFSGADSFTYTATDTVTSCVSAPATINLIIGTTPAPVAQQVGITGCQGVGISGNYNPTGGSGTYTQFTVISGPSHGIVSPTGSSSPAFTYTSNATFVGTDSFIYTVEDSNTCVSNLGIVNVTVDQPHANDETITDSVNHPKTGTLSVSGGIGSLTYAVNPPSVVGASVNLVSGPSFPTFVYTPAPNFTGTDTFTFTATDSFCVSNLGTVTVQVISLAANDVTISVCENESTQAVLSGTGGVGCYMYNVPTTSVNNGTIIQPLGNCAPQIIYTAPTDFVGTDTFTYTITDQLSDESSTGTVTIQVTTLPVPADVSLSTCQNVAVSGNFTASGGASANYIYGITGSGPAHGIVELSIITPDFNYNPVTGFVGTDTFTYTATDSAGCVGIGEVDIEVDGAPIGNPVIVRVCMNTLFQGNLLPSGGTRPYGIAVPNFSVQGGVVKLLTGNMTSPFPVFSYVPPLNYIGPDSFTYTITDANGCVGVGTVSITVDAARAIPLSIMGCADTSFGGTLAGIGGIPPYNFTYSNGPFHGTLNPFNISTGVFTYNPTAGFAGSDSFTFSIRDQNGAGCLSNPALVSITVDRVVAPNENFTACANGALVHQLEAQGGSGTLLYTKVGPGPVPGNQLTLSSSGLFAYNPTAGFVGADGFFYVVTDTLGCNSDVGQVSILVEQPIANPVILAACKNGITNGVLNGTGGVGNLTYIVPDFSVNNGTIVNSGSASFTYTPPTPSYTGSDSFVYSVQDSLDCVSDPATVAISVSGPSVSNLSLSVCGSGEVIGQLIATGGTGIYTYQVTSSPANGIFDSFCPTTGVFTYTPNAGFTGIDTFIYQVTDSNLCISNMGIVSINVQSPIASPLTITMCPNTSANLNLAIGSTGGSGIYTTYTIVAGPDKGVLVPINPSAGTFMYTPFAGYLGTDSFFYTVTDSTNCTSIPGAVNIVLSQLIGNNIIAVDCVDALLTGQATAVGGSGIYTFGPIVINATNGSASINATGGFSYDPNPGFSGSDSFTYTITDSYGCNSLASVFVTVGTPIAISQNITGCGDTSNFGTLSASQGAGGYVFSINSGPTHGTATILDPVAGIFVYNPTAGYLGPDSFEFIATDSQNCASAPGTISINVINNVVAQPASIVTCEDVFMTGSVVATGGSGIFINYQVVTPPDHGTLLSFCADDGTFTYNPTGGFTGMDSFTYSVTDSHLCTSAPGTVTINVNASPIALPVITDLCTSMGTIMGDLNPTGGSGTYVLYTVPTTSFEGGSVSQPMGDTSPEFIYIAPTGLSGADGFNYVVLDSNGCESKPGSVIIEANGGAIGIGVDAQDTAGQTISGQLQGAGGVPPYIFALVTSPFQGVATVSASGFWTYTANQTASGTDFFTFSVMDSSGCIPPMTMSRSPAPNNTVIITITGPGYPFDIIGDFCPLT